MKSIAIIGNGQLAKMLQESVAHLQKDVVVELFPLPTIDNNGNTKKREILEYKERLKFFDIVTYEIENIDTNLLTELECNSIVSPSKKILSVSQDRYMEKQSFKQLGIPTNKFIAINKYDDLLSSAKILGFPFFVKKRRFGYDGKGQMMIRTTEDCLKAWSLFKNDSLIAEELVDFDIEVSQIAARNSKQEIVFYPLAINRHEEGILRTSHPTSNFHDVSCQAQNYITTILNKYDYIGTLAIEFFLKDNNLYANEIAPRVHNSGHWSINGCTTSQFENHMRAIASLPLDEPKMLYNYIQMINLIGEELDSTINIDGVTIKSYHKELRPNRKMGHINIVNNNINDYKKSIETVYNLIRKKQIK